HILSLEKYHIVECGHSIQRNPDVPEDLYAIVDTSNYIVTSAFLACTRYTSSVLNAMKTDDIDAIENAVKCQQDDKTMDPVCFEYIKHFFKTCLWLHRKKGLYRRLAINESSFNHLLVWPIMELAVDDIDDEELTFVTAEHVLKSSAEEYKADGCILFGEDEICLLETSGKFMLEDNSNLFLVEWLSIAAKFRNETFDIYLYGYDHIKMTFGALCLFNAVYKKHCWANEDTALKLRIPFVHARGNMLHLWSLELCSTKLYLSKKVYKSLVPEKLSNTKDIVTLGNFVWLLKVSKRDTCIISTIAA
ncbi:hypothetical protein BD560DRAFT_332655, partial [Blakeslea trispora]